MNHMLPEGLHPQPDGYTQEELRFAMAQRRIEKGQFFHQPCFGVREYPAHFRPWPEDKEIRTAYPDYDIYLGIMLYGMDYSDPQNIRPMFFRAELKRGVLDLTDCEVLRV